MNLDKYEGHTPGPWKWLTQDNFFSLIVEGPERFEIEGPLPYLDRETNPTADRMFADARLIAAAPLLLAEVKRLREYKDKLEHAIDLCASKEIERWIDKEEARIWEEEE